MRKKWFLLALYALADRDWLDFLLSGLYRLAVADTHFWGGGLVGVSAATTY